MFQELSLATVRHALTAAGPLVVALTPVTGGDWEAFVGAAMTIAGLLWSYWRKIQNRPRGSVL